MPEKKVETENLSEAELREMEREREREEEEAMRREGKRYDGGDIPKK